jgi:hypothetical protein
VFGQVAQVDVAGSDIRPGIDHRDHRLVDLLVVHSGGAEHGAGWRTVRSFLNLVASHHYSPDGSLDKKKPAILIAGFLGCLVCSFSLNPLRIK